MMYHYKGDMLPYDIDGHCRYSLQWISGIRIAYCKSSLICSNVQCPYFQEFKNFNTVQLSRQQVCPRCGEVADHCPCEAKKIWKSEDGHNAATDGMVWYGTLYLRKFAPIFSAHPYCARRLTCHVMH